MWFSASCDQTFFPLDDKQVEPAGAGGGWGGGGCRVLRSSDISNKCGPDIGHSLGGNFISERSKHAVLRTCLFRGY